MVTRIPMIWRWIMKIIFVGLLLLSINIKAENPFNSVTPASPEGKFYLEFVTPKKQVYKDIETIFKNSGKFEGIVKGINHELIIPNNVKVKFAQGVGPYYDPVTKEVHMSYDYIFYLTTLYVERYPKATDNEMLDFSLRATTFLFYHEMGHAIIDMYQIPVISNEETAADNLAVVLALELNKDGFDIVMDSAELFDLLDVNNPKKIDESDYWDEHELDAQRFYNILCLAYGKYPDKVMAELKRVHNKKLYDFINDRGKSCIYQYDQQLTIWTKLLDPYFRN